MHAVTRIVPVALFCALVGGCGGLGDTEIAATAMPLSPYHHARTAANTPDDPRLFPDDGDDTTDPSSVDGPRMQCVPYARAHSGVDIHGNANTWWHQADGVYARGSEPVEGAVLVLTGYGRGHGHVAVVRRVVTNREIRIDHANWFNDGLIYVNDPVIDVSADNDWSQVKVWNIRTGTWGTKTYTVQGFIGPGRDTGSPLVSSNVPRPRAGNSDAPLGGDAIARQIAMADRQDGDSDDDR